MSDDTQRAGESPPGTPLSEFARERSAELAVLVLMGFMLWVRLQSYDKFVKGGRVFFSGNDPYYHYREVNYIVRNWPATMPFDPWTNFPQGTSAGQFGTLYDQLVATAALVVGLGDPSQQTIGLVLLVAPPVFAALTALPIYYVGKRLGGTEGGLFGVFVLALLPGSFLQRSVVGSADHHIAEVFFQAVAVLAILVALAAARRHKPVWELVVDRDYEALREPVGWAALAGVAVALYVWTWPPAVLLMGIFGTFLAVKMTADYLNGDSPEPVGFVGATAMAVTGVLALVPFSTFGASPTSYGLLQPLLAFAVAAGCVFLAWLAREFDARDLDRELYPLTVGGIAVAGILLFSVALPDTFRTFASNYRSILGFSTGAGTRTIREAQPFLSQVDPRFNVTAVDVIMAEYGLMFFTALLALLYMLARPLIESRDVRDHGALLGGLAVVFAVFQYDVGGAVLAVLPAGAAPVTVETLVVAAVLLVAVLRGDHDSEKLFVAVWLLFVVAAAFTQIRFNYYLALGVVAMNAYGMGQLFRFVGLADVDLSAGDEIEPYQVMAVMLALLVVLPVLVTPVAYGQTSQGSRETANAMAVGENAGPSAATEWDGTLGWMRNNTPEEGTYGGADNRMDYYGTYPPTDDYEYPDGAYGVISWWDYGHWITVYGERIPTANPFQQGATHAANFLLAPNETRANQVLDERGDDHEKTRYVMIDWQMVSVYSKFEAPTVFYDEENVSFEGDFVRPLYDSQSGRLAAQLATQRYYESTMVRLYKFNGSYVPAGGPGQQVPVVDWETTTTQDGQEVRLFNPQEGLQQFQSERAARQYLANDSTAQIGGFANYPADDVGAVKNYRLVKVSESQNNGQAWVKVFERVDGAEVSGTGPPNSTVTASVNVYIPSTNETFTYTQKIQTGEDGSFTTTLPYSTTGQDQWGPEEGYTNTSVRAQGSYRFSTGIQFDAENESLYAHTATANVTEAQVIGEDQSPVTVDLERSKVGELGGNESDTGNGTDTGGNETDTGNGTDTGNQTDTGNETVNESGAVGSLAGPSSVEATAAASRADAVSLDGQGTEPPTRPAGTPVRAGLFALVAAALLVEVRDP